MSYPLKGFFYDDFCTLVQHLVPLVPNLINYDGHIKWNKSLIFCWAIGLWGAQDDFNDVLAIHDLMLF